MKDLSTLTDSNCGTCTGCSSATGDTALPFKEYPLVVVTLIVVILLFVKRHKKSTLLWSLGLMLFVGLIIKVQQGQKIDVAHKQAQEINASTTNKVQGNSDYYHLTQDTSNIAQEFEEFEEFNEFESTDEFEEFNDELTSSSELRNKSLYRTLIAFILSIVAGFLFRYTHHNSLRYVILLGSLVYFGFYSGGCPCMISSLQNFILLLLGEKVRWVSLIWFIGLLPITYLFGKIWCGWVCHLGALQEFLYRPGKLTLFRGPNFQKGLKTLQILTLIALLIQLIWTRTNLFIKIDPFKVAFNLYSVKVSAYVLLGVLLVSSLLIYRPFCRGFCPVGLILSWVKKIPGAFGLNISTNCKSCSKCHKSCSYQAINKTENKFSINNNECIMCGECMNSCRFNAISSAIPYTPLNNKLKTNKHEE
ncbi:4Fe-4S binding protein [Bacteroidales bacterium]|nr:4Fe-4S binding protein [Bacteroidales bacterium]